MEQEIYYPGYTLDGELTRFIKVWISVLASLSYTYLAGKLIPKGIPRLSAFLPIISLFFLLPLNLHSMHLGGFTAFFVTWLTNFKLLLFAFDNGPLSHESLSLPKFLAVACFPIIIQHQKTEITGKPVWNYAIKGLLLASLVQIYSFSEQMHPSLLRVIYFLHIYSFLELILALMAAMSRIVLKLELEPQFNEPYLSRSLQDFWGRRWNIMVTRTLRPTVYDPCLRSAVKVLDRRWAAAVAVMVTFLTSAVMHEVIFFYFSRSWPTGMTTWFFLFHGICLVVEKKVVGGDGIGVGVRAAVGTVATVGFVMVTSSWWFLPELFRCNAVERSFAEYRLVGEMMKGVVDRFWNFRDGLIV